MLMLGCLYYRYQVLCEMVDCIVGQANMIRAIVGLPERELVEDTSQDEGIAFSVTEQ